MKKVAKKKTEHELAVEEAILCRIESSFKRMVTYYERGMEELAGKVYEQVIVPFCEKNHYVLDFYDNQWNFVSEDGETLIDLDEIPFYIYNALTICPLNWYADITDEESVSSLIDKYLTRKERRKKHVSQMRPEIQETPTEKH